MVQALQTGTSAVLRFQLFSDLRVSKNGNLCPKFFEKPFFIFNLAHFALWVLAAVFECVKASQIAVKSDCEAVKTIFWGTNDIFPRLERLLEHFFVQLSKFEEHLGRTKKLQMKFVEWKRK